MRILLFVVGLLFASDSLADCRELLEYNTIRRFKKAYFKRPRKSIFYPNYDQGDNAFILTDREGLPNCAVVLYKQRERLIDRKRPIGMEDWLDVVPHTLHRTPEAVKKFVKELGLKSAVLMSFGRDHKPTNYLDFMRGFHLLYELIAFHESFHNNQRITRRPPWSVRHKVFFPNYKELREHCYEVDVDPDGGITFENELMALETAYEASWLFNSRRLGIDATLDYLERKEKRVKVVGDRQIQVKEPIPEARSDLPKISCFEGLLREETFEGMADFVGFYTLFGRSRTTVLQYKNFAHWRRKNGHFSYMIGSLETALLFSLFPKKYFELIDELEESKLRDGGIPAILRRELEQLRSRSRRN